MYTKEKHPGNLSDTFDWDEEDVLLVQISDEEYVGKGLEPMGLQKVRDDVVRIVVRFDDDGTEGEAARRYMTVDKGALDGMKFIVETEDGKRLNTN